MYKSFFFFHMLMCPATTFHGHHFLMSAHVAVVFMCTPFHIFIILTCFMNDYIWHSIDMCTVYKYMGSSLQKHLMIIIFF